MARNQALSGKRLSWKIVPAFTDAWWRHWQHSHKPPAMRQASVAWQCGQTKPEGQRSFPKYSQQASSVLKHCSNSIKVLG
jgi:hypothetical protein